MKIYKKISKYNYSSRQGLKPKYITIHYIGAVSSAKNNAIYFTGGDRQASAHFYVDHEIWQGTALSKAAWHCGGPKRGSTGGTYYKKCTNLNSIGIEMCVKENKKGFYIIKETEKNMKELVPYLMKKYHIPKENVIRHYDVNGKKCPNCYTEDNFKTTLIDNKRWEDFRNAITKMPSKGKRYLGRFPTKTVNKDVGSKTDIKRWQKILCWAGFKTKVDGLFGPDTLRKTKAFQRQLGVVADGSVGSITRGEAKLYRR